jgi:hypothetical protein
MRAEAEDLRHMPLVQALWTVVKRHLHCSREEYEILEQRYKTEYDEVKGELKRYKAQMGPV